MPRYYKIMKITEHRNNDTKIHYKIKTCVSFKRNISELNKSKLKWKRPYLHYYSSRHKSDIKIIFNKLTNDKKIIEVIKSPTKKYIKPKLTEKNKIIRIMFNELNFLIPVLVAIFLMIPVLYFFTQGILQYSAEKQLAIIHYTKIISFVIIGLFIVAMLYIKLSTCYIRVIKRTIMYGYSKETNYHLQTSLSKKGRIWVDIDYHNVPYYIYGDIKKHNTPLKTILAVFDYKTTEVKITEQTI